MHLKYMIYWFSTVNHGLKTFPKPSFEKGEAWFIWAGHCPVCPAWTLTGLAEFKSNYHFCTEPARMFEAIMKRGVCFIAVGYTLPLIVRQKNIILQSFCLNNLNLTQKAWCLSNFVTPIHSVRCLLVWNKIFCDAPNISSTVVNIYQMGGGWGTIFCIIGRLLSVCLIVTQTWRDGRERYKWGVPPTYDIWWLLQIQVNNGKLLTSTWEKIYFSVFSLLIFYIGTGAGSMGCQELCENFKESISVSLLHRNWS